MTDDLLTIPMKNLRETAKRRPEGYIDVVLAEAEEVTDKAYRIRRSKWRALANRYRGTNKPLYGPGSLLSRLIVLVTGESSAVCAACDARVEKMNKWGWLGCYRNRHEIVGWLCDEAAKRKIEVDRRSVYGLLKTALKEARRAT